MITFVHLISSEDRFQIMAKSQWDSVVDYIYNSSQSIKAAAQGRVFIEGGKELQMIFCKQAINTEIILQLETF